MPAPTGKREKRREAKRFFRCKENAKKKNAAKTKANNFHFDLGADDRQFPLVFASFVSEKFHSGNGTRYYGIWHLFDAGKLSQSRPSAHCAYDALDAH